MSEHHGLDTVAEVEGMTLRERWSSWQREPFTSESTRHISVWEKTTSRARLERTEG